MNEKYLFARRVASLSFSLDTIFQAAALLLEGENTRASPSSSYVAYAPHPMVPLVLFSVGVLVQILWLMKFWPVINYYDDDLYSVEQGLKEPTTPLQSPSMACSSYTHFPPLCGIIEPSSPAILQETELKDICPHYPSEDELQAITTLNMQIKYLPFYIIGTLCRVSLVFTLATRHFDLSQVLAIFYFLVHIYSFFGILGGSEGRRFPHNNVLTYCVVRLRMAVSALYLWKVRGALDIIPPPSIRENLLMSGFFVLLTLSTGPDPTLGVLLSFVLFGFSQGPHHDMEWQSSFTGAGILVLIAVSVDWCLGVRIRRGLGWQLPE